MLKIYHNPKCSKSRQALQYLQDNNYDYEIIEYLNNPPTHNEIHNILKLLNTDIKTILRNKEKEYKLHNITNLVDNKIIDIVIANPILLERPIIIANNTACIARPLDNLINMLTKIS